jgi:hypothetical protein
MITMSRITSVPQFLQFANTATGGIFWNLVIVGLWVAFYRRAKESPYASNEDSIAFASLVVFIFAFLLTLADPVTPLVNPALLVASGLAAAVFGGLLSSKG